MEFDIALRRLVFRAIVGSGYCVSTEGNRFRFKFRSKEKKKGKEKRQKKLLELDLCIDFVNVKGYEQFNGRIKSALLKI